ncbi:hypothetical protein D8674_019075 [Pyrus ussuriensis x Pyrus communis]|uniref:Fungal lipase-type domain-containing protein n=1 Tax=Pyrus ussuriensis x Pyrus communis TaxID=2448454 RepID=A0A5N5G6R5_9ROSA|nr:hypothetical protein D8674_019075 [Pyrus ussuriensis x Pyrus communis]
MGGVAEDHRWVIVVLIYNCLENNWFIGKSMEWIGYVVDFILNLLSLNGGVFGLLTALLRGKMVVPQRDTETFKQKLYSSLSKGTGINGELDNWGLMDLCMTPAKLAYENAQVIRYIAQLHFVDFYNCWNVHMGFLEALGLGDRTNAATFYNQLIGIPNEFTPDNCVDRSPDMVKKSAYYAARRKLKRLLKEHKNAKFMVTGYSLGGALAIPFPSVLVLHEERAVMQRFQSWLGYVHLGSPRLVIKLKGSDAEVSELAWCIHICYVEAHLNNPVPKYFRVVYCNDLVPRLPYHDKTFLFKHFGVCLYHDSLYNEQRLEDEPNNHYFGMRYLIPEYLNAAWELIRSLATGYTHGPEYREGWFSIFVRMTGLLFPLTSSHSLTDYINSVKLGKVRIIRMSKIHEVESFERLQPSII